MGIQIVSYAEHHVESVKALNERLRAGGEPSQFPTQHRSTAFPPLPGRGLFQDYFLAVDGDGAARGGYILKHQDFHVGKEKVSLSDFQMPLSEGAVDRTFAGLASQLLFDALKKEPLLLGLGMGGFGEPIARLHKAAGFHMFSVPFFFRVLHPYRFCRRIRFLRRRWPVRLALDGAACTGLAWIGLKGLDLVRGGRLLHEGVTIELVDAFDTWADEIWARHQGEYPMIAVRDGEVLRLLYPAEDPRFRRLLIRKSGQLIGWCVVLDTQMRDHKQFGTLRVGSLVDAFAAPTDAAAIVGAATAYLKQCGVDLIVTNQSHSSWCRACAAAGLLCGPSNFLFSASKALTRLLVASDIRDDQIHVNRGDGDGPINL